MRETILRALQGANQVKGQCQLRPVEQPTAKRKELGSMNVKNVSACGHVAGSGFRRYLSMKDIEKKNWFCNRDGNLFYFYYVKENKKHMIVIEPSEEMVDMIRRYLPAGVYQD